MNASAQNKEKSFFSHKFHLCFINTAAQNSTYEQTDTNTEYLSITTIELNTLVLTKSLYFMQKHVLNFQHEQAQN